MKIEHDLMMASKLNYLFPETNLLDMMLSILIVLFGTAYRGVPAEGRKLCDDRYRCIERVCRSVGTLILCDFCYFRSKKTTKITSDGLRPSSNMLNISLAMGMFSY